MGHGHPHSGHPHRPFVSRREFIKTAAALSGAAAAGPFFWKQLAYAADTPARLVHTTFGHDSAREMRVSWMTDNAVKRPFVQLGPDRIAASTVQYDGYPGYFHNARLTELSPRTPYHYEIGHDGKLTGRTDQFRTSEGRRAPFTFTAFGDQGTEVPIGQPPQQPQANTDLARAFNPALHLIVGDLAYAEGNQFIWDDWFTMIEPMAAESPGCPRSATTRPKRRSPARSGERKVAGVAGDMTRIGTVSTCPTTGSPTSTTASTASATTAFTS